MHHGNGAFIAVLLKIRIEFAQLVDQEHTLVYHGSGGERAHIGGIAALLKNTPDDIQFPVKIQAPCRIGRTLHKALINNRHGLSCPGAQYLRIYRHLTPAQEVYALLAAHDFKQLLGLAAQKAVLRDKEHTNAIVPLLAQVIAQRRTSERSEA